MKNPKIRRSDRPAPPVKEEGPALLKRDGVAGARHSPGPFSMSPTCGTVGVLGSSSDPTGSSETKGCPGMGAGEVVLTVPF